MSMTMMPPLTKPGDPYSVLRFLLLTKREAHRDNNLGEACTLDIQRLTNS